MRKFLLCIGLLLLLSNFAVSTSTQQFGNDFWCWYPCFCWYNFGMPNLAGNYPMCWCWYPCGCWNRGFFNAGMGGGGMGMYGRAGGAPMSGGPTSGPRPTTPAPMGRP
jgi:hypothetical protein